MIAAVFARKRLGSHPSFQKGLAIGAGALVALFVFGAGLEYRSLGQLRENDAWVTHTNEVLNALEGVVSMMKDAETGQRGYLITGDDRYLEPYNAAVADIQGRVQRVKQLTADNPRQQARIPLLEQHISAKLEELKQTIALRKKDPEAARQLVLTGEGKKVMDATRAQVREMGQEERDLFTARDRQSRQSYLVAVLTILSTLVLGLGMVGAIVYFLQRHLSERQKAEEALRQQAALLDLAHDAIIVRGTGNKVVFWSRGAEETYGWTSEEAMGQVPHDLLKTRFPKPLAEIAEDVAEKGRWEGELTHARKDGQQIVVASRWAVQRDESGRQVGVLEINRDITESKRAEEVLRESEQRRKIAEAVQAELRIASLYARSLIEASLDPLVTISPNGQIMDVNNATELVTGVGREALVGSDFAEYFTEPEKASAGYQKVLADGRVNDYPLTIRHTSGRTTDVLYNATVYRNEAGEVQGVFAAARDITARRRAEEELDHYREHLEELVAQRTEELARSNKDLEQFAYVASHDLQEPLRAVSGFVVLLQQRYQGKLDEKADGYIANAVDGAARMQSLIGDLLAYSRVGTRGGTLAPTAAQDSFDNARRNLAASIRDAGAVITSDPMPIVPGDALQLTQLFQNLIGNAVKFRGDRRPEIHVGARREQDQWLFWVRDNGIGVAPEYADRIFLIFQRLHTRKKYAGTGIGLAICKKIVERHGGKIWVESQPDEGATFYFTISERGERQ